VVFKTAMIIKNRGVAISKDFDKDLEGMLFIFIIGFSYQFKIAYIKSKLKISSVIATELIVKCILFLDFIFHFSNFFLCFLFHN
jgi:hypothetical protein